MNLDITYEQLKPFLTKENLLWTEAAQPHEGPDIMWHRLFDGERVPANPIVRVGSTTTGFELYSEGRVFAWTCATDLSLYQLPEAAMQALGLAEKTAAQELREALGDDEPAVKPDQRRTVYPVEESIRFRILLDEFRDQDLDAACEALLDSTNYWSWPASLSHHHAYEGGLITHTFEVMDIALHLAKKFPQVNKDVLIAATLWHDFAKVHEYRVDVLGNLSLEEIKAKGLLKSRGFENEVWVRTDYASKIGHINGSAIDFAAMATHCEVDPATIAAVVHCILAHHGPVKEWGSPVAPQTLEALILHQADMLSAGYGATK